MAGQNPPLAENLCEFDNVKTQAAVVDNAIDPGLIKFVVALFVVSVLVEVIDRVSHEAAWTLTVIIVLGLLMNNPLVTRAIFNFGTGLGKGLA